MDNAPISCHGNNTFRYCHGSCIHWHGDVNYILIHCHGNNNYPHDAPSMPLSPRLPVRWQPHWLDSLTWSQCSVCAAQTAEQGPVHNLGPSCWPGCKFHCRAPLTWSPRATSPYLLYGLVGWMPTWPLNTSLSSTQYGWAHVQESVINDHVAIATCMLCTSKC